VYVQERRGHFVGLELRPEEYSRDNFLSNETAFSFLAQKMIQEWAGIDSFWNQFLNQFLLELIPESIPKKMEGNRESIPFCLKSEKLWIDSNILIHFPIPFYNFPKKNHKIETKNKIFQRTDGIIKRIDSFFVERNCESIPFFWQGSGIVNQFLFLDLPTPEITEKLHFKVWKSNNLVLRKMHLKFCFFSRIFFLQ